MLKANIIRLYKLMLWDIKKRFYDLRYPVAICSVLLFSILVLPTSVCQYLDTHAELFVSIVNLLLSLAFFFGFTMLSLYYLSEPYATYQYQKEKLSDISTEFRLFARVLVNLIQNALVLLFGYATMWGMTKFADESHSYFSLKFETSYGCTLLLFGLLAPLIYLTFVLRRYYLSQQRHVFLPFVAAYTITTFLQTNLIEIPYAASIPVQTLAHLLRIFGTLALVCYYFTRCCYYEKNINYGGLL